MWRMSAPFSCISVAIVCRLFRIRNSRHTFASRLVMAGVDIRTVGQLMGRSTIQMTMRYAHLAPEHSQMAVDRLVPSSEVLVTKSVTGRNGKKR